MAVADPTPDPQGLTASSPRVQERAAELLSAAGALMPEARGGAVLALVEAAELADPPRVDAAGGGCGGRRRIVISGDAVFLSDGMRPTHLLARAVGPDGAGILVLLARGDIGVQPWPGEGATTGEVAFRSVRLDADRVLVGRIR